MTDPIKVYDGANVDYWFDTKTGHMFSTDNDGNKLPEPAYPDWKDDTATIKWDDKVKTIQLGNADGYGDHYIDADFLKYASQIKPSVNRSDKSINYIHNLSIAYSSYDNDLYSYLTYKDANKNFQSDKGDILVVALKSTRDGGMKEFSYDYEKAEFIEQGQK